MLNRQGGMSLLEVLAAIAVGTVLFIGLTDMIDVSMEDARGQQAAYHQSQVVAAAQKYITANYATLKGLVASGAVVSATVPDLADFLPEGFTDQNSYRQNTCVLIRQGASADKLDALVVGYGGLPIPDKNIASVAMNAGQGAGYIPSTDTGVARGPSWSLNTTPYRSGTCLSGANPLTGGAGDAGHLVSNIFYEGPGQLSTDFLYRDPVPGRPELNRMNVPLQMASAGLVNVGDGCTQTAMAIEATTKDLVVCDSGKWRYSSSSWKEPVANWGVLTTKTGNDGDVRVTLDNGRAFVRNGGTWTAMGIDQNGDLYVPRDILASRDMIASRDLISSRDVVASRNINASGDVNITRNLDVGQKLTARGYIDAKGDVDVVGYMHAAEVRGIWMAADVIVLDGIENPGGPCNFPGTKSDGTPVIINPVGTTLRDTSGRLLTCASDSTFRYQNGAYVP